jgi:hypothetical protein
MSAINLYSQHHPKKLLLPVHTLTGNFSFYTQDVGKIYGLYFNLILVQPAYKKVPPGFGRIELSEGKSKRTYEGQGGTHYQCFIPTFKQ